MKSFRLGWTLALVLFLGFISMQARGDNAPRPDLQRFLAQLQREAASKPVARRPAKPTGITGEKADCTAQCGNGVPVTVTGCSSCVAVDQNCSIGQIGYAQCTGGSRVNCANPCPELCAVLCENGTTVSVNCSEDCLAVTQDCYSSPIGYVQCGGGSRVSCPPCQECYASISCPDPNDSDGIAECWGLGNECESHPEHCNVVCGSVYDACDICT